MGFSARRNVGEVSVVLVVAAAAMLLAPALASPRSSVYSNAFTWPWAWPSPTDPEIQQCWSSLANVEGCVQEIFKSFFTRKMCLGPACCKSISQLSEYCVPKIFAWGPFDTLFLSLVKGYCASIGVVPSPPTPVQAQAPSPVQDISPTPDEGFPTTPDPGDFAPTPVEGDQGVQPPATAGPDEESAPEPYQGFAPSPDDGEVISPSEEFAPSPDAYWLSPDKGVGSFW